MLRPITDILGDATATQVMAAYLGLAALMSLLWTRHGLASLIAAFVMALVYATAVTLRSSADILPFLPALLGIPLCARLMLHSGVPRPPRLAWIWIALIAGFAFRSAISDAGAAAVLWWAYYLLLVALGLALGLLLCEPRHRDTVVRGLALGMTGVIVVAIYAMTSEDTTSFTQGRLTPFGIQANLWGPTGLVGLFHALLLARTSRRLSWQVWGYSLAVLSTFCLLLSFSRGAIFSGVLAAVGVWLTGSRRLRGVVLAIGLAGAVAIMVLWGSRQDLFDLSASERLESAYSESRAELMGRLLTTEVRDHPVFGQGFFQKEGAVGLQRGDPHNSYLLVLLEQGIFGFGLLGICLWLTFHQLNRAKHFWPGGSAEGVIVRHTTFALTTLLLDGFTIPDLWTHNALVGFDLPLRVGIIAGLAARASRRARMLGPHAARMTRLRHALTSSTLARPSVTATKPGTISATPSARLPLRSGAV